MIAPHDTDRIRHDDSAHWFHPWESLREPGAERTIVTGAEGIHIVDENGQRLIDGPGGMWCVQIGYGRREMAEAIAAQVMEVPYMNPFSLTSGPPARLAARLAAMAPGDLRHVFFTTGGSTAVDTALRFVQFYNNLRGRREGLTWGSRWTSGEATSNQLRSRSLAVTCAHRKVLPW